jgi:hypothetical protein
LVVGLGHALLQVASVKNLTTQGNTLLVTTDRLSFFHHAGHTKKEPANKSKYRPNLLIADERGRLLVPPNALFLPRRV